MHTCIQCGRRFVRRDNLHTNELWVHRAATVATGTGVARAAPSAAAAVGGTAVRCQWVG
jgi:hypothetical protein